MGFLKQGFSGALAAVMVLTSGGLCVGQSVTIHAETKAKTYEDYKKVLNSLRIRAKNCYVNACPDDTARQLEIFVRHFPHLGFEKSAAV